MGANRELRCAYDLTVAEVGLRQLVTTGPADRVEYPSTVPGEALLHPVALASIAVLLINDHFLKAAWPGLITWKLSDFAGLVFFPPLLVASWQMLLALRGQRTAPTKRQFAVAIALTAALFAGVKLDPWTN